jgi:hypothetical protein
VPRPDRLALFAGLGLAALLLSVAAHVIPRRRGSARLAAREG